MKTTKRSIIDWYYEVICGEHVKELDRQLDQLVEAERITTGARWYVYNIISSYHAEALSKLGTLSRGAKSHTKLWDYKYHRQELKAHIAKVEAFIQQNSTCAFEESQKQLVLKTKKQQEETK